MIAGCWSSGGDHTAEDAAVRSIARALLAVREQAGSGAVPAATQIALTQVAAALACRDTQAIAGGIDEVCWSSITDANRLCKSIEIFIVLSCALIAFARI